MVLFTVFTPTFNRAHTLPRVYDSLAAQTCRDFEWLIVDDGSSDDTPGLVAQWQAAAAFPIRYVAQPNRGKHIAFNRGVGLAEGELFLTLDSDDACIPTALERLRWHWLQIPDAQRTHFSAVTGLCQDPAGQLVGDRFPQDVCDSNTLEMKYKYRVRGEKWGFQRTDVLRGFPFPEIAGATHCPETVVWSAIAREYTTRYVNEPLRIYYPSATPAGQLTRFVPARFLRSAVHYVRFGLHSGRGLFDQWRHLHRWGGRLLWLAALAPGFAIYFKERRA